MSRHHHHLAALVALSAVACVDGPVAPVLDTGSPTPSLSAEPVSRPWKGRCNGTATFIDATTLHIVGSCNITHMGLVLVEGTETVGGEPDGTGLAGTFVYTAANGDQLRTTSIGVSTVLLDFSGVTFSATETATGGTGRFRHATGSAQRIGSTRFLDSVGSYELLGTLTY